MLPELTHGTMVTILITMLIFALLWENPCGIPVAKLVDWAIHVISDNYLIFPLL